MPNGVGQLPVQDGCCISPARQLQKGQLVQTAKLGRSSPSNAANKHRAVTSDAFSTLVGEAAKYNSACVNTLRRSLDGLKLPGSREKSRSRFRIKGEKTMQKTLLSLFTILFLSACGTTGPVDISALNEPVPVNKARIIVTRNNSLLYLAGAADVRANGAKIASLGRGGSIVHDIPKGENTLSVSTPTAPGQFVVTFKAEPKKIYTFEISPRSENLMGGYGLGLLGDAIHANVSEQSGYFQIDLKDSQ